MNVNTRMKEYYENAPKTNLIRKIPVILRIDGKAFHTYTRGFEKPFDDSINRCMTGTMQYLCKNIQGCKLGYTQSDEISLLLTDFDTLESCAWFDYELEKITSIAASMASAAFNNLMSKELVDFTCTNGKDSNPDRLKLLQKHNELDGLAVFDARAFNIPCEEVCNYFIARQQDATKNSVQALARKYYGPSELKGLNGSQLQDKLFLEKNINWNDCMTMFKRGCCCVKNEVIRNGAVRHVWEIDKEIPIFTADRNYVNRFVMKAEA